MLLPTTEVTVPRVPLPLDCQLPKGTVWVLFLSPRKVLGKLAVIQILLNGTEVHLHSLVHVGLIGLHCPMSVSRHLGQWFSKCGPWTAQKCKFSGSAPESETWWMEPSNLYFNKRLGDCDTLKFENLCSRREARQVRQSLPASVHGYCALVAFHLHVLSTCGVGSPRVPLHVPIFSITHNQVGLGMRITHH